MSDALKNVSLALYLEGVRVPVRSALVTAGINQPASADIVIPPLPPCVKIRPRTVVHLFFNDHSENGSLADQYKLMFEGEVLSWAFQKKHNQRGIMLRCSDFTNWLYFIKPWQIMSNNFMDRDKTLARIGQDNKPLEIAGMSEDRSVPITLATTLFNKNQGVPGVLHSVLMSGLDAMKWSSDRTYRIGLENRFSGITDASYTDKVMQSYWLYETNLFNMSLFSGANVPIGNDITRFLQTLFYQMTPCPVASMGSANFMRAVDDKYVIGTFEKLGTKRVKNFMYMPEQAAFTIPPRCNVLFPDQIVELDLGKNYQREITRLIGRCTPDKLVYTDEVSTMFMSEPRDLEKWVDNEEGRRPGFRSTSSELTMAGNDERELGPMAEMIHIDPMTSSILSDPEKFETEEAQTAYEEAARRMLALQFRRSKFAASPANVHCHFSPYVVPGLPCMVVDISMPMVFHAQQVSHEVRENGTAGTYISGNFTRTMEQESFEFVRQYSDTLAAPLRPYNVGQDSYPHLLGLPTNKGCIATATGILKNYQIRVPVVMDKINTLLDNADKGADQSSMLKNFQSIAVGIEEKKYYKEDPGFLKVLSMAAILADYLAALKSKDVFNFTSEFPKRQLSSFYNVFNTWGTVSEKEYPEVDIVPDTMETTTPFLLSRTKVVNEIRESASAGDGIISETSVPIYGSIIDILAKFVPEDDE